MSEAPTTFDGLIERWGIASFSRDIGVTYSTANAMKQRNSVAAKYWPIILRKCADRGIEVTPEALIRMEAAKKARVAA